MEITEIKQQLPITQILDHYNLKANPNHMLHCPFHDDKTPSLQIYPKTNTFCCFSSACSAGSGDVIDFIQLQEKCGKHEALIRAKQLLGHHHEKQTLSRVAIFTKFYNSSLQAISRSEQAKRYAIERCLDWKPLKIGYISGKVFAKWTGTYNEQAAKAGLLKKEGSNYTHHFKNSLVFPLLNQQGQVVSIYGRGTGDDRHIYLPGPRQGLYPKYPKAETETLILTESVIDAATLCQNSILTASQSVLALYGTNGFTTEHGSAIASAKALTEVILFFDGDQAGRAAIAKLQSTISAIRPDIKISAVDTPEGEDINSLQQSHADQAEELFNHLLQTRKTLGEQTATTKEIQPKPQKAILNTEKTACATLRTENPELLYYDNDLLKITVMGGIKITGLDRLRVTLKITSAATSALPIRHSLDLYHSKQVADLVRLVSEQFDLSEQEVQYAMVSLTGELENYRHSKLEAMKPKTPEKKTLTPAEQKEALDYLKAPDLLHRTLKDITKSGIVGEERNAMIAYLTYISRKRKKPLHIMCLGASGSGKTYLQEKVGELVPEEDKLEITMLSENAFYYFGREELRHKLILIEDLDGAENVLYPLRELQSKRSISKTVTLKDNKGNLKTMTLKVEGPVCVSSCTTREKVYEDNANRCILLYIDTGKEQDKKITDYQRAESAGQVNRRAETEIKERFKNMQRLLKPIKVVNPYAPFIDLPEEVFRPRRTMILLLSFIETITFYHQYQRLVKTDPETQESYIESTVEDVEQGFNLLRDVLFSKSDELTGACRSFFEQLKQHLKASDKRSFYAREIRQTFRMNPNNLKRYLRELMSYNYLKVAAGNRHRGFEYELTNREDDLKNTLDVKLEAILEQIRKKKGAGRGSLVGQ